MTWWNKQTAKTALEIAAEAAEISATVDGWLPSDYFKSRDELLCEALLCGVNILAKKHDLSMSAVTNALADYLEIPFYAVKLEINRRSNFLLKDKSNTEECDSLQNYKWTH